MCIEVKSCENVLRSLSIITLRNGLVPMASDPTSPIAPSKVLVLLLPVGRIKATRFAGLVRRVQTQTNVRLGDITPDGSSASFSPLAFPNGVILYHITTTSPPRSHIALSPFEIFREPLIVLGICDCGEYQASDQVDSRHDIASSPLAADVQDGMGRVRDEFPRALVLRCLLFNFHLSEVPNDLPPDVMIVPTPERPTTMKTIMADISSLFLSELSTLARTIQTTPPLDLIYNATHGLSTVDFPVSERAAVPFRSSSLRFEGVRQSSPSLDEDHTNSISHEGSATSSPALSTSRSFQYSNTSQAQLATDTSSVHGVPTRLAPEEVNTSVVGSHDIRPVSSNSDTPPLHEQKKKNRNSSGTSADFANSRLKARQAIIIGSLYLNAGRWPDAMRELVDGATRAKVYNDHLWHAKALESLLITMLLLAWGGFEFHIPQICSTTPTRSLSVKRNSSISSPSFGDIRPSNDPQHSDALHNLCVAIPDLSYIIVSTYARAANEQGLVPFPFAFSESVVRLAKLITVLHLGGDVLSKEVLDNFVLDGRMSESSRTLVDAGFKTKLSSFLLRGYPTKTAGLGLSVADNVIVLSGIASVFSMAGMTRHQARTNTQLLSVLVPTMIHARKPKVSNQEGMTGFENHSLRETPASSETASMAAHHNELYSLQQILCQEYGVFNHNIYSSSQPKTFEASNCEIENQALCNIIKEFNWRSFGSRDMKKIILSLSIDISESMGDYGAALDYLAILLCTLRPNINPSTGTISARFRTTRQEQLDLAAKMYRILDLPSSYGISAREMTYWDPFLVCGVEIQEAKADNKLFSRSKSDFIGLIPHGDGKTSTIGPFLYDASSKTSKEKVPNSVIVAGEPAEFVVTLRNLYEFDIMIEQLVLLTEGVVVEQHSTTVTLGSFRRQRVSIIGTPLSNGSLIIRGCKIRVKGCREQEFLIFPSPWQPMLEIKTKQNGMMIPPSTQADSSPSEPLLNSEDVPKPVLASCTIVNSQPLLKIMSSSLSQSMLSILEGQTSHFKIKVQNISKDVSTDFLHVSFSQGSKHDPGAGPKSASKKVVSPFKWLGEDNKKPQNILPGASVSLDIEVFGIPDLSQCTVIVEYACLNQISEKFSNEFFTRTVVLPLSVTVNSSVKLCQVDVLPFEEPQLLGGTGHNMVEEIDHKDNEFVLLLVDFHNSWLRPLSVTLQSTANVQHSTKTKANEIIQPKHIERLMVLMPRIPEDDLKQPDGESSIVTSRNEIAPTEQVIAARRLFNCVQAVAERIRATWQEIDREGHGIISLESMILSTEMVNLICQDPVAIRINLSSIAEPTKPTTGGFKNVFASYIDDPSTLKTTLHNRTAQDLLLHIHLRLELLADATDFDMDLSNRLAWTGSLQRRYVKLRPGERFEYEVDLCFFCPGNYGVGVGVVEAAPSGGVVSAGAGGIGVVVERAVAEAKCTIYVGEG